MAGNAAYFNLLAKASNEIRSSDFTGYFELKRLLVSKRAVDRREFQTQFATYYRLHSGGLTEEFKRRYFEHLFAFESVRQKDPYTPILLDLYSFPRLKGDYTIQASFVSKLVAIHDESRPLYDRHVSKFFGVTVPSVGPVEFRIAGFVANLQRIRDYYDAWAVDPHFKRITQALFVKHPQLQTCHPSRVCDFLVWTVGDKEIR
jgi:hypothetical protein